MRSGAWTSSSRIAQSSIDKFLSGEDEEVHKVALATAAGRPVLRPLPAGEKQSGLGLPGSNAHADVSASPINNGPDQTTAGEPDLEADRSRSFWRPAAVIGGLALFSRWNRERDFRPLYSSLAPEDAAAVLAKVRENGSEFRLSDNGSVVLVPSGRVAELRLQTGGGRASQERPHRFRAVRQDQLRDERFHRTGELSPGARRRAGALRDVARRGGAGARPHHFSQRLALPGHRRSPPRPASW